MECCTTSGMAGKEEGEAGGAPSPAPKQGGERGILPPPAHPFCPPHQPRIDTRTSTRETSLPVRFLRVASTTSASSTCIQGVYTRAVLGHRLATVNYRSATCRIEHPSAIRMHILFLCPPHRLPFPSQPRHICRHYTLDLPAASHRPVIHPPFASPCPPPPHTPPRPPPRVR